MDPLNPAVPGTMAAIESLINKIGKPFFLDSKSSEFFGQVSQPGFGLYIHLYETIDMY